MLAERQQFSINTSIWLILTVIAGCIKNYTTVLCGYDYLSMPIGWLCLSSTVCVFANKFYPLQTWRPLWWTYTHSNMYNLRYTVCVRLYTLHWRHNERDGVSYHRRPGCSIVCSGADERKHQSSASLAFVRGIHQSQRVSNTKMFPFDDVIMPWWNTTNQVKNRGFCLFSYPWTYPYGSTRQMTNAYSMGKLKIKRIRWHWVNSASSSVDVLTRLVM